MEVALIVEDPAGRQRRSVVVQCDPSSPAGDLLDAIGRRFGYWEPIGAVLARTGSTIRAGQPVAQLRLRHADTIRLTGPAPRPTTPRALPPGGAGAAPSPTSRPDGPLDVDLVDLRVELDPAEPPLIVDVASEPGVAVAVPTTHEVMVVGGSLAGTRIGLDPGNYQVGRDPGAAVHLPDPSVSQFHAQIAIGDFGVHVADLGSTNGTYLDGVRLTAPTVVESGQVVEFGAVPVSIEPRTDDRPSSTGYADGRILFNRPPRVRRPFDPPKLAVPAPPDRPAKAKFPVAAAVVPLILGVVMFLFTKQLMFMLFMLMSPVMLVFSLVDSRRSGRSTYRQALERFETGLADVDRRLEAARRASERSRRDAAPSPAHLVSRSVGRSAGLWERRPTDDDFLVLRVGMSDQPTSVEITGGDDPDGEAQGRDGQGPDPTLRARSKEVRRRHGLDTNVPLVVALRDLGVVGVAGTKARREAVARWLMTQAAVLHSPRDLAVVALVPHDDVEAWEWLRWLPHTEVLASGAPGSRSTASDPEEVRALFQVVEQLAAARREEAARRLDRGSGWSPHVLVFIAGGVELSRPALSRVLAEAASIGISAICLSSSAEQLPGECRAVVGAGASPDELALILTTGREYRQVVGDDLDLDTADEVARALAPLRDVGAGGASGEIPGRVLLRDLLGDQALSAAGVQARWSAPRRGLEAPLGVGTAGEVWVDLRRDGPHALVAGTTGAGKSELLQTLVASMAATHPPDRLAFVLVDYKGGAAFKDCVRLPHTTGFFTDLDAHLAERALVSLNAELRRREDVLARHGAKDLIEMEERFTADVPPNLVIVFDEFAFLKKEVPEFVAGVIDIAQRGRSLGVHLVLATQRPSGVIDDHIRANTNLRIALRVADDADSSDVIGRPDAVRIPKSRPGRAFLKTGHSEMEEIQTAYAGAPRAGTDTGAEVTVTEFTFGLGARSAPAPSPADGPTDLQDLVAAVAAAAEEAGATPGDPPWLDPLGERYSLDELSAARLLPGGAARPDGDLAAVVGMIDEPDLQRQRPFALDLGREGHVLVYGAAGSGKTTLLRTLAASLAASIPASDLHVYGLDFASRGLHALEALPHCGGVVSGNEIERVERLFAMVGSLVEERQRALGEVGAGSLAELRRRDPEGAPPYVVVLLDGYGGFHSVFEDVDHGELIDRLADLVSDGRAVGVHFVITADRRSGIPNALAGVIAARIVLRMADDDDYAWLGLGQAVKGAVLPPGRAFVDGPREVQVALVGGDPSGEAQAQELARLGERLTAGGAPRSAPPVRLLPEAVSRAEIASRVPGLSGWRIPLGLEGSRLGVATVDLDSLPSFLVAGPDQSGRSTTLRTLVEGVRAAGPSVGPFDSYLLAPRRQSPLAGDPSWTEAAVGHDACERLAQRLADLVAARADEASPAPLVVVVDDGDELTEGSAAAALERLVRRSRDAGAIVIAAAQAHVVHRTFGGWLTEVRKAKHGLILSPDVDIDGEMFGVRLPRKTVRAFPPGRGYLVRRGACDLVQVAD